MSNKTIKIFTEGGKDIGYGHITRCLSIYEEIQSREIEVDFIIHGEVGDVGILKNNPIINEDWIDANYLDEKITSNDYVIVDSYIAKEEHYKTISRKAHKALFIDDIGRIRYPNAIIVNPSLDSQNVDYSYAPKKMILTGPEYVLLRSAFTQLKRDTIKDTVSRVLVIMGGTDTRNITTKIIENVCGKNKNIIFDVIMNAIHYENVTLANKPDNINFHINLSEFEMCQLMLNSDLALSAAGQTIYELMATQTPFIAIQVAENQQNNIASIVKHLPSQTSLRYDDEKFPDRLQNTFLKAISYDYREKLFVEMQGIIDGNGKSRIVDALLNDMKFKDEIYLRIVHMNDINDIFELSNKDYVRQYSISKNKILWDDHVKWFNNVMKDNNVVFYVVTDDKKSFFGQIRYILEKDNAIVSISLSDELRGKGLSKMILDQSIEKLFKEKLNVNEIVAYVSESNVASMKIFKGLKFKVIDIDDRMKKLILKRSEYNDN